MDQQHRISINKGRHGLNSGVWFQPRCSCGWIGPDKRTEAAAEHEHDDHVLALCR